MVQVLVELKPNQTLCLQLQNHQASVSSLKDALHNITGVSPSLFSLTLGGKLLQDSVAVSSLCNHGKCASPLFRFHLRGLLGGKGGFGSMLRSMGSQYTDSDNKEACRDLSGRRLRQINDEKK
eukprot:Sdes_comp15019_c0_seq2m3784